MKTVVYWTRYIKKEPLKRVRINTNNNTCSVILHGCVERINLRCTSARPRQKSQSIDFSWVSCGILCSVFITFTFSHGFV